MFEGIDINEMVMKGLEVLQKEITVKCIDVNDKQNEVYDMSIYKFLLMIQSLSLEKFEIHLKQIIE